MPGRTLDQWLRFYMDGYDLSGYTRSVGPLILKFEEHEATCPPGDEVKGYLVGKADISFGPFNGVLDPVTGGLHDIAKGAGVSRVVMIPIGIQDIPAMGNWVFCGRFQQGAYQAAGEEVVTVNLPFEAWDTANLINFNNPWGRLLHAKGAETAVNSSNNQVDHGGQSQKGGYFVYMLFSSNGTVTLSVDDSANNSSWTPLSGATSGSINGSVTPVAGIVPLGVTATVRQYLRWQLAFGTATTATFASAFVRGYV